MVHKKRNKEKVSAIIPVHNEEKTIANVIGVLKKCYYIDEIIVVDDFFFFNTRKKIENFSDIIYLRNKKNLGKGNSLNKGAKIAKNNNLLFCDGDYLNLKNSHLKKVIKPVISGKKDMFIGVGKSNYNHKKVSSERIRLSFFVAGLRCLKRERWTKLPKIYKKGYRTEIGLTYYCNRYGKGWGYVFLDYSWVMKWGKKSFPKGVLLHIKMYLDLAIAYSFTNTIGFFSYWFKRFLISMGFLPKDYLLR